MDSPREHHDILEVFKEDQAQYGFLRVAAPMVRYSKVQFRRLLMKHGVKLCFTPMIIADSFIRSEKARQNEFTTTLDEKPLIAQFAARDAQEFANAAQLIYPYVDGIDLNCGCPQSWAMAKGYGCGLLKQPQLVKDVIRTVRRTVNEKFSVSLKIRLLQHESSATTVELARQLEMCGADFISLHGRTMWQKTSEPLNVMAVRDVKAALNIPLVANGSVNNWQQACDLHEQTDADGIMVARGLLSNPSLFNPVFRNSDITPLQCVQDWLDISVQAGDNLQFMCFHHHLTFMYGAYMKRKLRLQFNSLSSKREVYDFFEEQYSIKPKVESFQNPLEYRKCTYDHFTPDVPLTNVELSTWNSNATGKFFNEFQETLPSDEENEDNCELGSSFFADM